MEQGQCRDRVTPASTFKIALALMGFDAGFLRDATQPSLPFKPGYPAWGGAEWRKPVDPARWMEHSVVWYSQRIAEALGTERLRRQVRAFSYGNADISGDPGKNNGLERSWISSSLTISPAEQVTFLRGLVNRTLPVRAEAFDKVGAIIERVEAADGWVIRGKTGSAFPRRPDGSFDRNRAWGWYVGWAEKEGRTLVFAHLLQKQARGEARAGLQARDASIRELPGLARTAEVGSPSQRPGWTEEKCRRYRAAWDTLSSRTARRGLGPDFVQRHEAFIASGCTTQGDVCPRSPEELEAANMLTIMAMNAGMASTFLPFGCPKPAGRS